MSDRLLEVTAYNLYMATLVGHPAPRTERLHDRMSAPEIGDLVLEVSTIYHEDRVGTRMGRLLRMEHEHAYTAEQWYTEGGAAINEPIPTELVWYVELSDGREMRWVNARFIAIPTVIDRYDEAFVSDPSALRSLVSVT